MYLDMWTMVFSESKLRTEKSFRKKRKYERKLKIKQKWRSRPLKIKKIPAARPTMVGAQQVTLAYGFSSWYMILLRFSGGRLDELMKPAG